MFVDATSNGATEIDGNRVSNEPPEHSEVHLAIPGDERVVAWKALQDRRLPQRNGSMLVWMAEPAISEAVALGRHRGRWFVPFHAPIHARIRATGLRSVAFSDQLLRPVAPSAAWLGRFDPPQILF